MKRSTIAPVGMALLFLSFAAVPFSLSGHDSGLSSRLDSLASAWSQVAGVFLTVYQPSNAANLLALEYSNSDTEPHRDCAAEDVIAMNSADVSDGLDDATSADSQRDWAWSTVESVVNEAPSRCTKVPVSVPAKRPRLTLPTRSSSPVAGRINVRRIDLSEVMKLTLQSEHFKKFINLNLIDHKIETKFEMSKLLKPTAMPAKPASMVKRGPSGCDEASEAPPTPGVGLRERMRRNRIPVPAGVQS
jgi:hypothetical protein